MTEEGREGDRRKKGGGEIGEETQCQQQPAEEEVKDIAYYFARMVYYTTWNAVIAVTTG